MTSTTSQGEQADPYMEAYHAALKKWSNADALLNKLDFESYSRPGDIQAEIAAAEARVAFQQAKEQFDVAHLELLNHRVYESQQRELDALELGERLDRLIATLHLLIEPGRSALESEKQLDALVSSLNQLIERMNQFMVLAERVVGKP